MAGAIVGNSSAKGDEPVKKALETVRAAGRRGAKAIKAARSRNKSSRTAKQAAIGSVVKRSAEKSSRAEKNSKPKKTTKKPQSKTAAARKAKRTPSRVKKKT
jgi:hypothetical protein